MTPKALDTPKMNRAARREAMRAELIAKREARAWPEVLTYRAACERVEHLKRTKPRAWWPLAWIGEESSK